ncbi:dolichyl glycosyltransferase [Cordyceps militaris CM01]|uniref:Alpha-1,3-glucosyltransferase n=1 Tax=Cordyceps militaris (strain CM01) TaxID=983644 RepID=G3J5X8_CORMM|nr:dolichyl glycosyltransferase [Cordyceps militaris CM01]EGX96930.1 dolichyl glycosyltransferase [Cordyceps militaris CM01]
MPDATYPTITQCALVSAAFKILLFPAYKSTDFEVHRNWLAITHSLPLSEWYYEDTSQWTLDYPPFFAYFEWLLSHVARLADPAMVRVYNLEHDTWPTVYFQRTTVLVTELLLAYALQLFLESSPLASRRSAHVAALSVLLSPGLLIIDHIHFQYNGFMYGILVLSLVLARGKNSLLASGLAFAALLCFKHIYVYLAPAYFIYLLRTYCLSPKSIFDIRFVNCVKLGGGIVAIVAAALGPFAALKQMPQLLSRLFPFARGLCHAYWASNVWALYSFADRALIVLAPRLGLDIKADALQSVTRGLVGDTSFAVLPEISARTCFALTLLFQALPLIKLFMQPTWENFIGATTLCGYASFLFGYHVHEKAILLVIIPFSLIALQDRRHLSTFRPLAVAGHVSLFPLLFTPAEFPIKTVYTLLWLVVFLTAFDRLAPASNKTRFFLLDRFNTLYIALCIPLVIYTSLLHQLVFGQRLEFLPLMLTSVYTAIGVFQHDFAGNEWRVYEEHKSRVLALVPPDKLFEYHVHEGGCRCAHSSGAKCLSARQPATRRTSTAARRSSAAIAGSTITRQRRK